MKYGFFYDIFEDCVYFLYIFQNYNIVMEQNPKVLRFRDHNDDEIIISNNMEALEKICDKVFVLFNLWRKHTDPNLNNKKMIFCRPGENIPPYISDDDLKQFLDKGNICVTSSLVGFEHENFISDYALNMYYFYNYYGYGFLNYYENPEKKYFLGMYHGEKHISNALIENRIQIYNKIKKIAGDELHIFDGFKLQKIPNEILLSYNFFSLWDKNFVTSYTDYNTTVCNIIFETCTVLDGIYTPRDHITEKTLKCLLFSGECNIFFIWVGSPSQYQFLKSNNFWALNFEFIKDNPSRTDIFDSVEHTVNFLTNLKKEMTNDQLYSYLLKTYGKNLKKNKQNLYNILNNCSQDTLNKVLNHVKKDQQ